MTKYVVVDIESTGNSPKKGDRMIQFAAVVVENKTIIDTYTTFINPQIPIPSFIQELTGIDNELIKNAPTFPEVASEIVNLIKGNYFVAHNAHFDLNFLQEELSVHGFPTIRCPVIDTVEMSKVLMPTLESYKLSDIAIYAGFDHTRPHQADSDAFVTAEWFISLLEKTEKLPIQTLDHLQELAASLKSDLFDIFSDSYQKKKKKNQILDGFIEHQGLILKKPNEAKIKALENLETEFNLQGIFSKNQKGEILEKRIQQEEMMSFVFDRLANGDISLIETEPGLGKIIGYLLPAAIYSLQSAKPIVVSTHTIRQQQQILENEIPKINQLLDYEIKVQVLKGKSHYLNLSKFERFLKQESEHYDEIITKMQILIWLLETDTGDVDELNLSSGGKHFWNRINTIVINDNNNTNTWGEYDFYYRAIQLAQNAHIIITNHHFLMADLTQKYKIFPDFDQIIIDEAHHFEKDVAKFFGQQFGYRKVRFWISQLGSLDQDKLLTKVERVLNDNQVQVTKSALQLEQLIDQFSQACDEFFQLCFSYLQKSKKNATLGKHLMQMNFYENRPLLYSWERLYDSYGKLFRKLEERLEHLQNLYIRLSEEDKLLVDDFTLFLLDFNKIDDFHFDVINTSDELILWCESRGQSPISINIYSQPINTGEWLAKYLYMSKKAIIMTSQTLTVKNSFAFILEELGLSHFPVFVKQFKTDVPISSRAKIFAMNDLPAVNESTDYNYIQHISSHIIEIAEILNGKLLVLFTSQEMLKKTFYTIKDEEVLDEYVLLAQGISTGSPHRLMKQFSRFDKSILFGSNIFWEGLEKQEIDLAAVIMVRLPFISPDDPIHSGKVKLLEEQGRNPFYNFSVPQAVLRFKQGFHHLVSNNKASGNLILFDQRIFTKNYGELFIKSIPDIPLEVVSLSTLKQILTRQ